MSFSRHRGNFYHPWSEHNYFYADTTAGLNVTNYDYSDSETESATSETELDVGTDDFTNVVVKSEPEEFINSTISTAPIEIIDIKQEIKEEVEENERQCVSLEDLAMQLGELAVLSDQSEATHVQNTRLPVSEIKVENVSSDVSAESQDDPLQLDVCGVCSNDKHATGGEKALHEHNRHAGISTADESETSCILINAETSRLPNICEMKLENVQQEPSSAIALQNSSTPSALKKTNGKSVPAFDIVIPPGCKSKFTVYVKNPQDPQHNLLVFSVKALESGKKTDSGENEVAVVNAEGSPTKETPNLVNNMPVETSTPLTSTNELRVPKRKISDPQVSQTDNTSSVAQNALASSLDHTYSSASQIVDSSAEPAGPSSAVLPTKRPRLAPTTNGVLEHLKWLDYVREMEELQSIKQVERVREMEFQLERARLERARMEAEFSRVKAEHELELANMKLRNARHLAKLNLGTTSQKISSFDWLDRYDYL